ncbi:MAG: hypothetical protein PUA61_00165 [Succinatimonas hippei]|nr:hypothetical protein [Succinatimonas hippei]
MEKEDLDIKDVREKYPVFVTLKQISEMTQLGISTINRIRKRADFPKPMSYLTHPFYRRETIIDYFFKDEKQMGGEVN